MKTYKTYIDEKEVEVKLENTRAMIDGIEINLKSSDKLGDLLLIDGEEILVDDIIALEESGVYRVEISGYTIDVKVVDPITEALSGSSNVSGDIISPMAGTISEIKVETGQTVSEGDVLLIISAMKMENQINSPISGVVRDIKVNINEQVPSGKLLITVEPKE